MQRSDFYYDLPEALIAQYPLARRSASRMLALPESGGPLEDRRISDLPDYLKAGDLLIFNNTRVIPARLHGHKDSGGQVEVLVERVTGEHELLAMVRASKTPKTGRRLILADGAIEAEVLGREGEFFLLRLAGPQTALTLLKKHGAMPLPPYIHRVPDAEDSERYQTVYARKEGAVAAPTAGLHFDEHLLKAIRDRGVELGYLTLHVGAGTFQPVRVDDLATHQMHSESIEVSAGLCQQITEAKKRGGRIVAVGTTVVRALESAAALSESGELAPYTGETRLFITPGYDFKVVDALLTNFHLPESTLLMLVSAFGGYDRVMRAYRHAVQEGYRFFSYGDCMIVIRSSC